MPLTTAAVFIQLSQRHLRDSVSRERSVDVSIARSLQIYVEKRGKGAKKPNSKLSRTTKNISNPGCRLTEPGRPDISLYRGNRTSLDAHDASWKPANTNTELLFYCPTARLIYSGDNSALRKRYF